MEPSSALGAPSQTPTAFRWESPSKKTVVYLGFDVVDRLNFDVMKGFGAVPRRGAEVGGILLGTVEPGEQTVVRIEENVGVACEHLRGPSYILSDDDLARFDEVAQRYDAGPEGRAVVGFYRSNTRDSLELAAEDRTLLDSRFAADGSVCLLIKPFATRIAEAAFFVREDAVFPEGVGEAFPFRRKEMGGGASRPPRPERKSAAVERPAATPPMRLPKFPAAAPVVTVGREEPAAEPPVVEDPPMSYGEAPEELGGEPAPSPFRSGWIWIPLSFIFLLLGVVLGFQIAISFRAAKPTDLGADPYTLDLKAQQAGESLHLMWSVDSTAMLRAQRGVLVINDGDSTKTVELNKADLGRGSVLYRNVTGNVRFRMEVFPHENSSVSETVDLQIAGVKESAPAAPAERGKKGRGK
jgi:hypothetical protein